MISHPHWILSHLSVSRLKLFRERNHYLGLLKQLDVKCYFMLSLIDMSTAAKFTCNCYSGHVIHKLLLLLLGHVL